MSVDLSRITFQPWKDYLGVVMQQGRVQLDADWNEWVAELARRLQAGTMDTLGPAQAGRAVVPSTTPGGFEILAAPGGFTIGVGRVYVDGLLAENHGAAPTAWDPRLAETTGTAAVSFFEQPYLPFNDSVEDPPADVFNRPVLAGGPHLVYLDVWQREVTHLHDPDLVEKAVGVDTTARLQTVWQVRVLSAGTGTSCATDDDDIPGWSAIIRPSGARLTTSTGDLPDDPNPCLVPPAAGYKGTENQLYRIEIHRGGPQATATFKWSRDNATVATRVTEIHGGTRLVVESLGRDDVLGFHPGDWVEIVEDWHELHGRPGVLRRIRPGDGIVPATRSILFDDALPAGLFPVDGQGRTDATRHTRVRRWDQSNQVRRADGTVFHNLNASASSDGIPVPPPNTVVALELGILVEFGLAPAGEYRTGDYWTVTARAADGSIDLLDEARPRGIHHHYARLAVVTLPATQEDCRIHWPPAGGGESCDCTVCVHAEAHNAGTATIQQAIDAVRARGGTVCLDAGTYVVDAPLNLDGARSVRIRGQGWRTLLQAGQAGAVMNISRGTGVAIENLAMIGAVTGAGTTALVGATHCIDLALDHLAILAVAPGDATAAAVGLSGVMLNCSIRDCALVAEQGVIARHTEPGYLLAANLRIADTLLFCSQQGLRLDGATLHFGETRVAGNLVLACAQAGVNATGASFPNAAVTISGNVIQVPGTGIRAGVDGLRLLDNELVGAGPAARAPADAIVFEPGLDTGAIDRATVTGNRIRGFGGNGIAIRHTLGSAMIKSNVVETVGLAAIAMEDDASASYLCIENNHFADLGVGFNRQDRPYFGVHLLGAARADVLANVFANVARVAQQPPLRAAIAVQASAEVRVAGNRLFGIGPPRFVGRTIGIAVAANFRQLAVDDNAVARVAASDEVVDPAAWQAIVVAGRPATGSAGGGVIVSPGVIVAPLGDAAVYLSAFRVGLLPARQGTVSARGNRLRSQATGAPTLEIDDVVGVLANHNDAEATGATANAAVPVARIQCRHASATGNRLIATGDGPAFVLTAPRFAVLGNVTSGPIHVNGPPLLPPWADLNVPA
jgi:hypothetical protein